MLHKPTAVERHRSVQAQLSPLISVGLPILTRLNAYLSYGTTSQIVSAETRVPGGKPLGYLAYDSPHSYGLPIYASHSSIVLNQGYLYLHRESLQFMVVGRSLARLWPFCTAIAPYDHDSTVASFHDLKARTTKSYGNTLSRLG